MNEMEVFRIVDNRTSPQTVKEYEVVDGAAREDISELKADLIELEDRTFSSTRLDNDFIYGRYLSSGFNSNATYCRNNLAYPPGSYEIGPYTARSFAIVEYISDTQGNSLTNWGVAKQTITTEREFYVSFAGITGDADIEAISANFPVVRLSDMAETLEDRVDNALSEAERANGYFEANTSKNRFNGVIYLGGGYVVPTDGTIQSNSGHAYTDWIDISEGRTVDSLVLSCNHTSILTFTNLRYALYTSDKTFISGALGPTLNNDATLNRDYTVIEIPNNATYMRFSMPNVAFSDGYYWQVEYGDTPTAYSPYTGDFTAIKTEYIKDNPIIAKTASMTYGIAPAQATADTLTNGQTIVVENNSVMKNQRIAFFAMIGESFDAVLVGHGKNSYGYYIKVDGTNMTYGSNGSWGTAVAHGLTIEQFLGIIVEVDIGLNIKTTITTAGGTWTRTQQINSSWRGDVFAESVGSTFNGAVLTWESDDYKCPIWAFGDSYFTLYTPTRWPYYVAKTWGYNNILLNGYPGENAESGLRDFKNAIKHGTPKYVLWCEGMNNPDGADAINVNWLEAIEEVRTICAEKEIELICTTIPEVTNTAYKNDLKNAWIRESGIRYVDFASAVEDVTGWLSDDGVHPSEIGGRFLALKLLADVPEIYQGK